MIRAAGFALDLLRANLGRSLPFKLTFAVDERCSCRCAICHLWQAPRPGADASEIERLFGANPHLSWINLTGGDVVERADFVDVARAAAERTRVFLLDFPTAGQEPEETERKVKEVLRLRVPHVAVTVSLDGPPDVHDRLRGRDGAFARAAETLRRLRALRSVRFQVVAGLTLSSRNDADPERLVGDLLRAAPFLAREDLHFNLAHHSPHAYRNRRGDAPDAVRAAAFLEAEPRRRRPARGAFARAIAAVERAYWRHARAWLETGRAPVPCAALASTAFVDASLCLYPCISWDAPLADLRACGYSLRAALREAAARRAREAARTARCPGCWTPCEAVPSLLARAAAPAR